MNAKEFAEYIRSLGVSYETLATAYSKQYAEREFKTFCPKIKEGTLLQVTNDDPVLDFAYNYDFGKWFCAWNLEIHSDHEGWSCDDWNNNIEIFGSCFENGLAIDIQTGEVGVYDHEYEYHKRMYRCAANGYKFLDALALYMKHIADWYLKPVKDWKKEPYRTQGREKELALVERLTQAAGGEEYREFWHDLINVARWDEPED